MYSACRRAHAGFRRGSRLFWWSGGSPAGQARPGDAALPSLSGSPRLFWADPRRTVNLSQGTLALLLAGGVALGAQHDRLQTPGDRGGAGPPAPPAGLLDRLALHLPSFSALSQGAVTPMPGQSLPGPQPGTGPGLQTALSPYFIADAAAAAAPAVVNIMVTGRGAYPVGSSGSGFICDPDGTILTNAHVVADALGGVVNARNDPGLMPAGGGGGGGAGPGSTQAAGAATTPAPQAGEVTVTLQDGRVFEGRVVSYDAVSDLALVRVSAGEALPSVRLGSATRLRVGEWVVALGSPLHLQNSVTAGIVSCVDRKACELGLVGGRTDYIQTDAAINTGNSGGPLLNLAGEVVGISCMKALAADGVSFAIPVDTAVDVMRQLATHGRVIRPYAGIKMLELNRANVAALRRRDPAFPEVRSGILVPQVAPGSPAERAGLRPGDVVVGWAGLARDQPVTTKTLIAALGDSIGKPLTLHVMRAGAGELQLALVAHEVPRPPLPPAVAAAGAA